MCETSTMEEHENRKNLSSNRLLKINNVHMIFI
ncbi:hypothetical protein A2U01_0098205, partial [Trifolium medium]|nr:hypothetical protein [Trifolium medium]